MSVFKNWEIMITIKTYNIHFNKLTKYHKFRRLGLKCELNFKNI